MMIEKTFAKFWHRKSLMMQIKLVSLSCFFFLSLDGFSQNTINQKEDREVKNTDTLQPNDTLATFYSFKAISLQGKEIKMSDYRGKVVLVVNTASKCGFTPQYEGLEKLYQKYKDKGLVILGFPCNQFANQEPGDDKSIESGCVLHYGVTFPMFSKIDVNGTNAHEIFKYLKNELSDSKGSEIKWNFTKFMVDKSGKPVARFASTTKPEEIEKDLIKLLN
jgi:glutathione peroxidase